MKFEGIRLAFVGVNSAPIHIELDDETQATLERVQKIDKYCVNDTFLYALSTYHFFLKSQAKGLDYGVFGEGGFKIDGFDDCFNDDLSDDDRAWFLARAEECKNHAESFENMLDYVGVDAKELLERAIKMWGRLMEHAVEQRCYLGGEVQGQEGFGFTNWNLLKVLAPDPVDPGVVSLLAGLDPRIDPDAGPKI